MKHLLLAIIFFFALNTEVFCQNTIKIETVPVEMNFNVNLADLTLSVQLPTKVTNLTNQEIQLKWIRSIKNKPSEWDTQVCDKNFCYLPLVNSNIDQSIGLNAPVILSAGESFDLIFYVLPNGVEGSGEFEVIFSLANNPNTPIDTARFVAHINNQTTSAFDIKKSDLRVFPNPASDYFELTNSNGVDRVVVYNLLGREMRSYQATNGQRYSITGLPNGLYLVSLVNNKEGVLKTLRLTRRSLMP